MGIYTPNADGEQLQIQEDNSGTKTILMTYQFDKLHHLVSTTVGTDSYNIK